MKNAHDKIGIDLYATPVFDGAKELDVTGMLEELARTPWFWTNLFLGWKNQSEKFDRPVTVGTIYMLKLTSS